MGMITDIQTVAELGINHNGDLALAKRMILAAKECGADYVKFQKRSVDICYTPEQLAQPRETPFGKTNGDLKWGLEFGYKEYDQIDSYCTALGMRWTASPWDVPSVEFLEQYDPPYIKIASASITDKELLAAACATGKPLHISTGMADADLINEVVMYIEDHKGQIECIYHCTSTYPAETNELNLLGIRTLQTTYPKYAIGYSGHERGVTPSLIAAALGAKWIERHFTLDRASFGTDQAASLEPAGFTRLCRDLADLSKMMGDGVLRKFPSELPIEQKLRRVNGFNDHG